MYRFFVNKKEIDENEIILIGENFNHAKVLRLRMGEKVVICDGLGMDYITDVKSIEKSAIVLKTNEIRPNATEPKTKITLYQALPKSDKMEYIIQKAVEIGVYKIVPIITQYCIQNKVDKLTRWQKIIESAAKQSHRGLIPQILPAITLPQALDEDGNKVVLYENASTPLKTYLQSNKSTEIGIFIGPEGGFSESEITLFSNHQIPVLSLGSRILKTETASLVAIVQILYETEL